MGCQQLLISVPWGVQIVKTNLKDTFHGKTTKIWCRGVLLGVVGCRGVISSTPLMCSQVHMSMSIPVVDSGNSAHPGPFR